MYVAVYRSPPACKAAICISHRTPCNDTHHHAPCTACYTTFLLVFITRCCCRSACLTTCMRWWWRLMSRSYCRSALSHHHAMDPHHTRTQSEWGSQIWQVVCAVRHTGMKLACKTQNTVRMIPPAHSSGSWCKILLCSAERHVLMRECTTALAREGGVVDAFTVRTACVVTLACPHNLLPAWLQAAAGWCAGCGHQWRGGGGQADP